MATLLEQISNRAASAPQQKIQTIDPNRLMQNVMGMEQDYRMAQLNNQYESDRMRAKAHMDQLMALQRDKKIDKRARKATERERQYNRQREFEKGRDKLLGEGFAGNPLLSAEAQYYDALSQQGAYKMRNQRDIDDAITRFTAIANTPFDIDRRRKMLMDQISLDDVTAYITTLPTKRQKELGYDAARGGYQGSPSLAINEYLMASPAGQGTRKEISDQLESELEQHRALQANASRNISTLISRGRNPKVHLKASSRGHGRE